MLYPETEEDAAAARENSDNAAQQAEDSQRLGADG